MQQRLVRKGKEDHGPKDHLKSLIPDIFGSMLVIRKIKKDLSIKSNSKKPKEPIEPQKPQAQ